MTTQTTSVPFLDLNDGNRMPQLGFGVFQVPADETAEAVGHALETGYRAIDTAAAYGNEEGVRDGVLASGLDRSEVEEMIRRIGEYADLYDDLLIREFGGIRHCDLPLPPDAPSVPADGN